MTNLNAGVRELHEGYLTELLEDLGYGYAGLEYMGGFIDELVRLNASMYVRKAESIRMSKIEGSSLYNTFIEVRILEVNTACFSTSIVVRSDDYTQCVYDIAELEAELYTIVSDGVMYTCDTYTIEVVNSIIVVSDADGFVEVGIAYKSAVEDTIARGSSIIADAIDRRVRKEFIEKYEQLLLTLDSVYDVTLELRRLYADMTIAELDYADMY